MSLNDEYFSVSGYAKVLGVTVQTLDKLAKDAEGSGFELGEPDGDFNGRVWHVSKWRKLRGFRLQESINLAIELGMVVTVDTLALEYDKGYRAGYSLAHEEIKSQQLVPQPTVDEVPVGVVTETSIDFSGLMSGGFTPITDSMKS